MRVRRWLALAVAAWLGGGAGQSGPARDRERPPDWRPARTSWLEERYDGRGPFETAELAVAGGTLRVTLSSGDLGVTRDALLQWARQSAETVAAPYGRLPQPRVSLLILAGGQGRVYGGMTFGGRWIRVHVGREASEFYLLQRDWVLTHELIHTAFPDLPNEQAWMEEGLATYYEPALRARAGLITEYDVWAERVRGMPQGLPGPGDRGLDRTPTWGRTYWGGALYWLLVDLTIRERSEGRRSLDDVLRAVLEAGGDGRASWSLARLLEVGDRAAGSPVLTELHARMGPRPDPVDLNALWARLGLVVRDGRLTGFGRGPQADLRREMLAFRRPTAAG